MGIEYTGISVFVRDAESEHTIVEIRKFDQRWVTSVSVTKLFLASYGAPEHAIRDPSSDLGSIWDRRNSQC